MARSWRLFYTTSYLFPGMGKGVSSVAAGWVIARGEHSHVKHLPLVYSVIAIAAVAAHCITSLLFPVNGSHPNP